MKYLIPIFLCCFFIQISNTEAQSPTHINKTYQPPQFADTNRKAQLTAIYPIIAQYYQSFAEKNHIPGYAFGIMLDGQLVYTGSGGLINIDKKIPATPNSFFRIASMSKSFTAMAILQLRDAGRLRLDDPVYKYIPSLKGQKLTTDAAEITIRHLLTHSAGLPEDNPWGDRQLAASAKDLLKMIEKGISFSNETGVSYEYSNVGFAMLGYIIQKVSGKNYGTYIKENIWTPLQMQHGSTWEYSEVPKNELAHGYRWINNLWQEQPMLHDGIYGAMGGMITTINDFSKYVALHQNAWPANNLPEKGPIKRSSIREMHQPWRFSSLNDQYTYPNGRNVAMVSAYGYGLRWQKDARGRTYVGHSGGLPGFGSNWNILPEYGLGVIFFANATYAPTSFANMAVLDTILQLTNWQPRSIPASTILQQRQQQLVQLLPNWQRANEAPIFAMNFWDDYSLSDLQIQSKNLFEQIGNIINISPMEPENQLRGSFFIEGTKGKLKVYFTLTPEHNPTIQEFNIRLVKNN